ncbi:MAG TPA: sigma factor, partial [Planctomycetaceae bacterium]|nr:sigma factor [Planctomycetaceae bacterium]
MRLLAGDQSALGELWHAQKAVVERWLLKHYAGHLRMCESEDLLQEALLRLWSSRSTIDPGRRLLSRLWRILRNLVANCLKSPAQRQWMV